MASRRRVFLRPQASDASEQEGDEPARGACHGRGAEARWVPGAAAAAFRPRPHEDAAPPAVQQPAAPQSAEAPAVPRRDDDRRLEVRRRGVLQQRVADVDVGRVEVDRGGAGRVPEAAAAAPGPAGLGEHVPEARVLDAAAAPAAAPARRPGPDGGARRRLGLVSVHGQQHLMHSLLFHETIKASSWFDVERIRMKLIARLSSSINVLIF